MLAGVTVAFVVAGMVILQVAGQYNAVASVQERRLERQASHPCGLDRLPFSRDSDPKSPVVCGQCVPGTSGNARFWGMELFSDDAVETGIEYCVTNHFGVMVCRAVRTSAEVFVGAPCPLNTYCSDQATCVPMSSSALMDTPCNSTRQCNAHGLVCSAGRCLICSAGAHTGDQLALGHLHVIDGNLQQLLHALPIATCVPDEGLVFVRSNRRKGVRNHKNATRLESGGRNDTSHTLSHAVAVTTALAVYLTIRSTH